MYMYMCVNDLIAFGWGGIIMDSEGEEYHPDTI